MHDVVASFVVLGGLFLVHPAWAQEADELQSPATAIEMLEICVALATSGGEDTSAARKWGWGVSDRPEEFVDSPFDEVALLFKLLPEALALEARGEFRLSAYGSRMFSQCSLDVHDRVKGSVAFDKIYGVIDAAPLPRWFDVEALDNTADWEGEVIENDSGIYGSWRGLGERQGLLLNAHQDRYVASLQLTSLPSQAAPVH